MHDITASFPYEEQPLSENVTLQSVARLAPLGQLIDLMTRVEPVEL